MEVQEELLTVRHIADRLHCPTSFVYKHHKSNIDPIPVSCYVGNRPRFKLSRVEPWLKAGNQGQDCGNISLGSAAARDRRIKQMSRRCHQMVTFVSVTT